MSLKVDCQVVRRISATGGDGAFEKSNPLGMTLDVPERQQCTERAHRIDVALRDERTKQCLGGGAIPHANLRRDLDPIAPVVGQIRLLSGLEISRSSTLEERSRRLANLGVGVVQRAARLRLQERRVDRSKPGGQRHAIRLQPEELPKWTRGKDGHIGKCDPTRRRQQTSIGIADR